MQWPAIPHRRQAAVLALLFQMESIQWQPAQALRSRQSLQLRELIEHARRNCKFYRTRLAEGVQAWEAIPFLTRRDLQIHFDDLIADNLPRDHGETFDLSTGGSTGEPVKVRRTQLTQLFWEAATLRDHLWQGRDFTKTMAIIRHFEGPTDPSREYRWGNAVVRSGPARHLPISVDVDEQLAWLQLVNPNILLTYPPNLAALIRRMEQQNITLPQLSEVRTISGTVTEELRESCQVLLGVPLTDLYSTQEVGVIGLQCPDSGLLHVQSENVLVEVLDEKGHPCREGEIGQVVVTDLHNFAMPLIRYALRDWAEQGPICPCGRGYPTLRRIKGRSRNMAFAPDGRQYWPALGFSKYREILPGLRQYQITQTTHDAMTMKMVCQPAPSEEELTRLKPILEEALGHAYRWSWEIFDTELPLTASGKFEEFIYLVENAG